MAIKDLDGGKEEQKKSDRQQEGNTVNEPAEKENLLPHTEVKNAHASGDGSFGRSESSLPDGEDKNGAIDNPY